MPPMQRLAIAMAVFSAGWLVFLTSRLRMFTIALNTFSNAAFTVSPLRATSLGSATIGHEFSTSSRCWLDK